MLEQVGIHIKYTYYHVIQIKDSYPNSNNNLQKQDPLQVTVLCTLTVNYVSHNPGSNFSSHFQQPTILSQDLPQSESP